MKKVFFFYALLIATSAYSRTNLTQMMASTCESLGTTQGIDCVKLQRKMEENNVVIDQNGASICSLIARWGTRNETYHPVGKLVLSCFDHVANVHISNEVKDTCDDPIYKIQGAIDSYETVHSKVTKMMNCIDQLSVPVVVQK